MLHKHITYHRMLVVILLLSITMVVFLLSIATMNNPWGILAVLLLVPTVFTVVQLYHSTAIRTKIREHTSCITDIHRRYTTGYPPNLYAGQSQPAWVHELWTQVQTAYREARRGYDEYLIATYLMTDVEKRDRLNVLCKNIEEAWTNLTQTWQEIDSAPHKAHIFYTRYLNTLRDARRHLASDTLAGFKPNYNVDALGAGNIGDNNTKRPHPDNYLVIIERCPPAIRRLQAMIDEVIILRKNHETVVNGLAFVPIRISKFYPLTGHSAQITQQLWELCGNTYTQYTGLMLDTEIDSIQDQARLVQQYTEQARYQTAYDLFAIMDQRLVDLERWFCGDEMQPPLIGQILSEQVQAQAELAEMLDSVDTTLRTIFLRMSLRPWALAKYDTLWSNYANQLTGLIQQSQVHRTDWIHLNDTTCDLWRKVVQLERDIA